jgi:hypothetical protein
MNNERLKIFLLIVLVFLFSITALAQQELFKILTYSGKVYGCTLPSQNWHQIHIGESLNRNYRIRLDKNSYTALMYKDGRTMELLSEGTFDIPELERNINETKKSVTQKFANFVAQEIIKDKSVKKEMKTIAAVVRVKPNHIECAIPAFTKIMDSAIKLSWYSYPQSAQYVLSILNSDGALIYMDLVNDTIYTLNSSSLNLSKDIAYKWFIADKNNSQVTSDTNTVIFLSDEIKYSIIDTLKLINDEMGPNITPFNLLALAGFYENNDLNNYALEQFERVHVLAPQSEEYKKLFAKFLLKNKLFVRTAELLQDNNKEQ